MINKFNPRKTRYLRIINTILHLFFHEKKSRTKLDISEANNILIIDPTMIGDIIMLIPFLRIIRNNNNHCRITMVCCKWAKDILESQKLVDEFFIIDGNVLNSIKDLVFHRKKIKNIASEIDSKCTFDIAIEPRGDLRYIYFMHFCKAKRKVSYNYTGGECFLTDVITPSEKVQHLVEDKVYLLSVMGCNYTNKDIFPKLEISEDQINRRNDYISSLHLDGETIIGVHPGASLQKKQWDSFDKLIIQIYEKNKNICFVIFQGPDEEEAVNKVVRGIEQEAINYRISKSNISDYLIRISACDIMVCNDSGAGHIAAAYGVETFVIMGPFYPEMVKPYNENVHCFSEKIECKPCMNKDCDHDKECLKRVKCEVVAQEVLKYI